VTESKYHSEAYQRSTLDEKQLRKENYLHRNIMFFPDVVLLRWSLNMLQIRILST